MKVEGRSHVHLHSIDPAEHSYVHANLEPTPKARKRRPPPSSSAPRVT